MEVEVTIVMDVQDEATLGDIVTALETIIPYMADNVVVKDNFERTPTCDICGQAWDDGGGGVPDWNIETGNHRSCESKAVFYPAKSS
jgi:hypothetical protein